MEVLSPLVIRVLNHLIQGESWAQTRLIAHSGAQLLIDSGIFVLRLGIDERGLFHVGDKALQADVSITLPSDLPARFLFNRDTLFSSVKLGGSADIAESLAFVLRNLRWDSEADLAQLVGDIPARRLARFGQILAAAIQDAVGRVTKNFSEYAVEEAGMLALNRDVTAFGSAVSCLQDDVARLEKRISKL
ncbi:MAG: sterol-binding protein [Betaproteobacteria bacterium HGW-Betaproteobacteria-4]|jgi:ubiquinone biosynthesis protein UbiJ|nr:MAG: sterol-binding protein [Betaproteobacteria bacterium HGW-Betaproteobacteria-4]